ncbi:O-antigen polymerase [Heyndrickxia coagulans]|uniref:O-antigen polymerase n=1 Tax=Heyndrickxia coagulans TaxID=1398 RepID=UPI00037CAA2D|nr:O-antigen polymerase [Heyndrickxia coagulans]
MLFYLLFIILIIIVLIIDKFQINPLTLTFINLIPIFIGYYTLDLKNDTHLSILVLVNHYLFLIGYILFYIFKKEQRIKKNNKDIIDNKSYFSIFAFFLIVELFVVYHFAVGGIPILSSNVEMDRFNFSSSGLFGIPGRMLLFGLPFISTMVSILFYKYNSSKTKKFFLITWALYVFFNLLTGFKGALLTICLQFFLVTSISNKKWYIPNLFKLRNIVFAVVAIIYAIVMSLNYKSVSAVSINSSLNYLLNRATEQASLAGYFTINNSSFLHAYQNLHPFINEFQYYIDKYTNGIINFKSANFPVEMVVSSLLTGTPLTTNNFIVSVTLGGFAYLYILFGQYFTYFSMLIFGFLFHFLFFKAKTSNTLFKRTAYGFILLRTYVFLVNGSLAYNIINTLIMLLLFWFLFRISQILYDVLAKNIYAKKIFFSKE